MQPSGASPFTLRMRHRAVLPNPGWLARALLSYTHTFAHALPSVLNSSSTLLSLWRILKDLSSRKTPPLYAPLVQPLEGVLVYHPVLQSFIYASVFRASMRAPGGAVSSTSLYLRILLQSKCSMREWMPFPSWFSTIFWVRRKVLF